MDICEDTSYLKSLSNSEDDIEVVEDGSYKTSLHVASTFIPNIIESKELLEIETDTKITIPNPGDNGDIVITGSSKANLLSSREKIQSIVISSKRRLSVTHFISIPMTGSSFQNGLRNFKTEVLATCKDEGVREEIFQTPERLHLTIGVLVLCDEIERNTAAKTLEECKEIVIRPLLDGNQLKVEMSGIACMNNNLSKVDILYGKVNYKNGNIGLQKLADGISQFFSKRGLLKSDKNRDHDRVKLHVTLMNTKFYKPRSQRGKYRRQKREKFNATNIMKNFEDYYFGEESIKSIELSMMRSSSKTEYYKASASIELHYQNV